MSNWYATRDDLKTLMGVTGTSRDAQMDGLIDDVSRSFDLYCGRQLYRSRATQYYTSHDGIYVNLGTDLLSIVTLKTDLDGDQIYEWTWSEGTDFVIGPRNARQESPRKPYYEIKVPLLGRYRFPFLTDGIQIDGYYGYFDERSNLTTLGGSGVDSAYTSTTLTLPTGKAKVGQTIYIGSEAMFVSAVVVAGTDTVTVDRGLSTDTGLNGTTRVAHASGDQITVCSFPVVSRACLLQCQYVDKRDLAPLGVIAHPMTNESHWISTMDPTARSMLTQFRQLGFA